VQDTDGGDIDRLTLLAVNDVADFWEKNYGASLAGTFTPIEHLVSYDSNDPSARPYAERRPTRSPTRSTARAARSWRGTGP